MHFRTSYSAALLLTLASYVAAEDDAFPTPTFDSTPSATRQTGERAAAHTTPAQRRPAPAAGVPWNSTRQPAGQPARIIREPARQQAQAARHEDPAIHTDPNAANHKQAPAQRKFDPNARPITPKVGGADLTRAFELTKSANDEKAYSQIITLCKSGLQKGVDVKMAQYGRRLCSWAYNRRGEAYANNGMAKEAFEDFDAAVSLDSNQWRAVHNRGVGYALLGNHTAAIDDFSRAIELNPKFANAWFNRGEMLYETRDFNAAVRDYNQSLKLNPTDAAALNSRGHTLYRLRRTAEALADYNKALELDPTSAAAYVNRGDLFADQGRFAEAAKDYQTAVKINPSLGRAYQSAAWLMATCPVEKYRNIELAIEAAQKAIELDGDSDYRYLETLAAAQANAGEYEAAVATQQRAIESAPAAVAQVYKGRIERFKAGRPHREPGAKLATGSPAASRR